MPGSPPALAAELRAGLERLADAAGGAQARTYFREEVQLLGVATPDLRRLAAEAHRRVRGAWGLREALAACEALLRDPRVDVKAAGLVLLGRFRDAFEPGMLPRIRAWLASGRCETWATVDALCSEVLGPLLRAHPRLLARTWRWTASPNRWVRRATLVSLVPMARRGERLHFVYSLALRLLDDEEPLVQKACGWLLREAGRTDPARVAAFLRRHGPRSARATLRTAIERLPAGEQRRLLLETRSPRRKT